MSPLIEQLIQSHGPQVAEQISSRLGIPAEKAAGVLPAVAPLILGGLQRQAREPGGEAAVEQMVESQGDAGILDDVAGFFARQTEADPGQAGALGLGSLGGLFGGGGSAGPLIEAIAEKVGISKEKAGEIIPLIAPLVMGFLLKQKASAGTGGTGNGSLLTSLLDRDGDGSILDDVAGMLGGGGALGSLLGGPAADREGGSGGSAAGDLLGKALGGLLGGKK